MINKLRKLKVPKNHAQSAKWFSNTLEVPGNHAQSAQEDRSYERLSLLILKGELSFIDALRYKIDSFLSTLYHTLDLSH